MKNAYVTQVFEITGEPSGRAIEMVNVPKDELDRLQFERTWLKRACLVLAVCLAAVSATVWLVDKPAVVMFVPATK